MVTADTADTTSPGPAGLAGDQLIAAAEPHAAALICAVRDRDRLGAARVLRPLGRGYLYAVAILLAAGYPDDRALPDLLAEREAADERAVRACHAAHERGDVCPVVAAGERAYQRDRARRRHAQRTGDR